MRKHLENLATRIRNEHEELRILTIQLEELKQHKTHDIVVGSRIRYPYTLSRITVEGRGEDTQQRIACLEKRIVKHKFALDSAVGLTYRTIEKITKKNDPSIFQALVLKYVNNLSWRQIAHEMGYANESVPRKKINRHLSKFTNN